MKTRNVLLVYPKFDTSFWSFSYTLQYIGKKSSMPPLGLLTLGNMFPNGYNVKLVDMNVEPLTHRHVQWADLICTSTMIVQRRSLADVVTMARQAGKPIVAGGPHPTSYWEEMPEIDYLLLGEVEEIFSGFLEDLESGIAKRIYIPKERPAITRTPLPRYDLINMRQYGSMLLQFSRGCPFDCEFCDITKIYGRIPRTKTNEQILAEFQLLYDLGHRGSLFLVDDNFIGNRRDALRFLNACITWQKERGYPFNVYTEASMNLVEYPELMHNMVQAGFTSVFVGIETPTPEALIVTKKKQNIDKNDPYYLLHAVHTLQKNGLEVMGGFIIGLDGDLPNVFDLHIEFIKQAAIPIAMEGLLTALKDTDLYIRLKKEGRLIGDTTGTSIDTHLNFKPQMPEHILIKGYIRVLNAIYGHKLEDYFERCWTFLKCLDRSKSPVTASTPLTVQETLRFAFSTLRQILCSDESTSYIRFLGRVLTEKPSMIRDALILGAKGHHLRKVTQQVTAVESFKSFLAHELSSMKEEIAQCAKEGNARISLYVRKKITRLKSEYQTIHEDFRHSAQESLDAFMCSLNAYLQEHDRSSVIFSP